MNWCKDWRKPVRRAAPAFSKRVPVCFGFAGRPRALWSANVLPDPLTIFGKLPEGIPVRLPARIGAGPEQTPEDILTRANPGAIAERISDVPAIICVLTDAHAQ